jgi:flagellar hook-associated protein 2
VAGTLQGDSAVTGLLGRLRALVNGGSGASAVFARLSDIGLQLQRDGTLKVDGSKLDGASANLAELKTALAHSDPLVPGNNGLARQFALLATQALGVDGLLTTRTEGLRKLITKNQEQQQRYEDRVERYRERLVAQFSAMDANLSRLNALQSYVTQQLAALQTRSDD